MIGNECYSVLLSLAIFSHIVKLFLYVWDHQSFYTTMNNTYCYGHICVYNLLSTL